MPSTSGSFTAHVRVETTLFPQDQPNHILQVAELRAVQNSPDPVWNNSRLVYHGVTDLVAGNGTQRGYFVDEHVNGDLDRGTFEGRVTTSPTGQTTLEGTFTFISGTGKLTGITGGGTFRGRQVSPTEIEMTWSGTYQTATIAAGQVA